MSEREEEKDRGSSERTTTQAPAIRLFLLPCLPFRLFTHSGKSCFLRSCYVLPEQAKHGCFPKCSCKWALAQAVQLKFCLLLPRNASRRKKIGFECSSEEGTAWNRPRQWLPLESIPSHRHVTHLKGCNKRHLRPFSPVSTLRLPGWLRDSKIVSSRCFESPQGNENVAEGKIFSSPESRTAKWILFLLQRRVLFYSLLYSQGKVPALSHPASTPTMPALARNFRHSHATESSIMPDTS